MRYRWYSAFFELIVARTLQALGADLAVEKPTKDGTRPDFQALFGSGTIIVEATCPNINPALDRTLRDSATLQNILVELAPSDWTILIEELPTLGPSDSKREFRRVASRLLKAPSLQTCERKELSVRAETSFGPISLTLVPRHQGSAVIGKGPVVTYWSDANLRIRKAVRRKRRQVRGSSYPAFLAINGNFRCQVEEIDQSLFGRTFDRVEGKTRFKPNGEFCRIRGAWPTFAGVLFYNEVGFTCPAEPILFVHPRQRCIPRELLVLQQRLIEGDFIVTRDAKRSSVLADLHPVDPAIRN